MGLAVEKGRDFVQVGAINNALANNAIALVLAAGFSRRFGADKRWVILHSGKSIIEQVLSNITAAQLTANVVLRADDPRRLAHQWSVPTLVVAADDAERGLGASIAAAIQQLQQQSNAQSILICLADMPYIKPETYRAIADAIEPNSIAVPVYHGKRGHPVGFSSHYLSELCQLYGDHGARDLLQRHRDRVKEIAVDDPGIHRDIDTVADLLIGL